MCSSSSPLNALIVQLLLAPERADCAQVSPRTTFLPKYTSPIFAEVLVLQLPGELPCRCRESPAGAEAHRGVSHRTKPQAKPSAKPSAKPALHSDGQIEDHCHLTRAFWKNESFRNPFFRTSCEKKISVPCVLYPHGTIHPSANLKLARGGPDVHLSRE